MKILKLLSSVIAILSMMAGAVSCSQKPFVIASGGKAKAVIVVDKDAPQTTMRSAEVLSDYLTQISGAKFQITQEPVKGMNSILVGTPYKGSKDDETCVRVKDGHSLEVTGQGALGIRYAAQDLIETFGVVFCSADYDYVPKSSSLKLPGNYSKISAPFMEVRGIWTHMNYNFFENKMKLRLNEKTRRTKDTLYNWKEFNIGSNRYYKMFPEHHARRRGSTKPEPNVWWFCPCDEDLYPKLYDAIEEDIKKGSKIISLGVDDGGDACLCDKCLKLIHCKDPYDSSGRDYMAIENIYLVNKVARHFADKYPDVRFSMMGYWNFDNAPITVPEIKFEPNVICGIALLWRNHGRPVSACERSELQHDGWSRLLPENTKGGIYIWDYYADFHCYTIPFPNYDIMDLNLKHYANNGVAGISPQMQYSGIGDLPELHFWLFSKLAWDPYQDYQTLLNTYLNAAFGDGAPYIHEYLDIIQHARDRNFGVWIGCYQQNNDHWLTGDDCIRVWEAWNKAREAVKDDPQRLKMVERSLISPITMAILRYEDMIEPAKRMNCSLPTLKDLYAEGKRIIGDAEKDGYLSSLHEGGGWICDYPTVREYIDTTSTPTATSWPDTHYSFNIKADEITGGKVMKKMIDPDGTKFARIHVSLAGESESIWMNPSYAEAGYDLKKEQEGEWYVFADVRASTTVPYDRGAAYVGIYRSRRLSDPEHLMEISSMPVEARKGDTTWRTMCLGCYPMMVHARIYLMNGILWPTNYQDVKSFSLVSPELFEHTTLQKGTSDYGKTLSIVIDGKTLDGYSELGHDRYDNFDYSTIFNDASLSHSVTEEESGRWTVFGVVRVNNKAEFVSDAVRFELDHSGSTSASSVLKGELGNSSWQVVCLGTQDLRKGDKISLSIIDKDGIASVDAKEFVLMNPAVMESSLGK